MKHNIFENIRNNFTYDKNLYNLYQEKYSNPNIDKYFFTQDFLIKLLGLYMVEITDEFKIDVIDIVIHIGLSKETIKLLFDMLKKIPMSPNQCLDFLTSIRLMRISDSYLKIYAKKLSLIDYFLIKDMKNINYYIKIIEKCSYINNLNEAKIESVLDMIIQKPMLSNIENYELLLNKDIILYRDDLQFVERVNYLINKKYSDDEIIKQLNMSRILGNYNFNIEEIDYLSRLYELEDIEKISEKYKFVFENIKNETEEKLKFYKRILNKKYQNEEVIFNMLYQLKDNISLDLLSGIIDYLPENNIILDNIDIINKYYNDVNEIYKDCPIKLTKKQLMNLLISEKDKLDMYSLMKKNNCLYFNCFINELGMTNNEKFSSYCLKLIDMCDNVNDLKKFILNNMYCGSWRKYDGQRSNYYYLIKNNKEYYESSDDYVKNFIDIMKVIEESNDISFIKRVIFKFLKAYDSTLIMDTAYRYIKKYRVDKQLANLTNKEGLNNFTKTYIDGIPVCHLTGDNYSFLAHIVGLYTNQNNYNIGNSLKYNPSEWTSRKNEGSSIISAKFIDSSNMVLHRSGDGSMKNMNRDTLVLLFEKPPLDQIRTMYLTDAQTPIGRTINSHLRDYLIESFSDLDHNLAIHHDNEVAFDRELPNGETRMPIGILITDEMNLNENSPAVIWAKYYNLPLVMYHVKEDSKNEVVSEITSEEENIVSKI